MNSNSDIAWNAEYIKLLAMFHTVSKIGEFAKLQVHFLHARYVYVYLYIKLFTILQTLAVSNSYIYIYILFKLLCEECECSRRVLEANPIFAILWLQPSGPCINRSFVRVAIKNTIVVCSGFHSPH